MEQRDIRKQSGNMVYPGFIAGHLILQSFYKFIRSHLDKGATLTQMSKASGDYGEDLACLYLKKLGYKILARNYRIRGGEIDIVAKDRGTLVFIEVKTRWSHEYGPPVESMTFWKIKALLKTARFYVQKIGWGNKEYRLDFVGVDFACPDSSGADSRENPKIELIKNITG